MTQASPFFFVELHSADPPLVPSCFGSVSLACFYCSCLFWHRQPKFLMRESLGPFRLDLGDILYAPNTLIDPVKVRRGGDLGFC